jgi:hypothetical protein
MAGHVRLQGKFWPHAPPFRALNETAANLRTSGGGCGGGDAGLRAVNLTLSRARPRPTTCVREHEWCMEYRVGRFRYYSRRRDDRGHLRSHYRRDRHRGDSLSLDQSGSPAVGEHAQQHCPSGGFGDTGDAAICRTSARDLTLLSVRDDYLSPVPRKALQWLPLYCRAARSMLVQSSGMQNDEGRAWDCSAIRIRCCNQARWRYSSNPSAPLQFVAASAEARRS